MKKNKTKEIKGEYIYHWDTRQNSEDWFYLRLGRLTASDADIISVAGKGLESLVLKKVCKILSRDGKTGERGEDYISPAMIDGQLYEKDARTIFSTISDKPVREIGFVSKGVYQGCSPDGLVGDDETLEIKCPTNLNYLDYILFKSTEDIIKIYNYQIQFQLLFTEREVCNLFIYNPNFEKSYIHIRINRDEEIIEKIRYGLEIGETKIKEYLEVYHKFITS